MAETFKNQVDALTGFAGTEDDALSDWLTSGAKEIINVLPGKLKRKCTTRTSITDLNGTDLDSKGAILHITRLSADSGGYEKACREIEGMYGDLTNDSTDLINYATVTDPVYFITNNASGNPTLFVRPNPTSAQPSYVHHISYPAVAHGDGASGIPNFPDEAEYLVVLYAACKALQRKMNNKTSNLPTYSPPVRAAQISFSAYTTGLSEQDPGVFSSSVSAPVVPDSPSFTTPDIDSVTVFNLGTPPTYTSPTVGGTTESLTTTQTAITDGQIGTDADFTDVSKWFTALGEMIEDDEDIELASAQIEKINTYIQAYNIAMQDALNTFNKEGAEYQAKIQEGIQQAQINAQEAQNETSFKLQKETQEYASKLNRFNSELNNYQQNVGKEVQEYTKKLAHYQLELNIRHQSWAKVETDNISAYGVELNNSIQDFTLNLQKHTADYSWLQGQYTQLKADYQQGLQMLIGGGTPQQQEQRRGR